MRNVSRLLLSTLILASLAPPLVSTRDARAVAAARAAP
jgi:hypothetical protein